MDSYTQGIAGGLGQLCLWAEGGFCASLPAALVCPPGSNGGWVNVIAGGTYTGIGAGTTVPFIESGSFHSLAATRIDGYVSCNCPCGQTTQNCRDNPQGYWQGCDIRGDNTNSGKSDHSSRIDVYSLANANSVHPQRRLRCEPTDGRLSSKAAGQATPMDAATPRRLGLRWSATIGHSQPQRETARC